MEKGKNRYIVVYKLTNEYRMVESKKDEDVSIRKREEEGDTSTTVRVKRWKRMRGDTRRVGGSICKEIERLEEK